MMNRDAIHMQQKQTGFNLLPFLLVFVIALVIPVLWKLNQGWQRDREEVAARQVEQHLQNITDRVAADAVEQYQIAKRNGGTRIDICVQAMSVSAAYLQAKDESNYQHWKTIESDDCQSAGVPR